MVTSTNVIVTVASQISEAVAVGKTGVAGHSIGVVAAGQVMDGGVSSTTATVRLQVEALPQSSVAVQVRVTLYSCGQIPLGVVTSTKVMVTLPSHSSVAVAGGNTGVAGHSIGDITVGQVKTGPVLSVTETVWLHVEELLQSSVAVQVRVTLYSCEQIPLGVVTSTNVIVTVPSHPSEAVACGNTGVAGHSIGEVAVGQVITGPALSVTDTV